MNKIFFIILGIILLLSTIYIAYCPIDLNEVKFVSKNISITTQLNKNKTTMSNVELVTTNFVQQIEKMKIKKEDTKLKSSEKTIDVTSQKQLPVKDKNVVTKNNNEAVKATIKLSQNKSVNKTKNVKIESNVGSESKNKVSSNSNVYKNKEIKTESQKNNSKNISKTSQSKPIVKNTNSEKTKTAKNIQTQSNIKKSETSSNKTQSSDSMETIIWNQWRADVVNKFLELSQNRDYTKDPAIGTTVTFEFTVDNKRNISNIKIKAEPYFETNKAYSQFSKIIKQLNKNQVLEFPEGTQRTSVVVSEYFCLDEDATKYSNSNRYSDYEIVK